MSCECPTTSVYFNNDHLLVVEDLTANGAEVNTATITYQIYESDDDIVVGASGSLNALGTGGNYSVTVDQAIFDLLDNGEEYTIRVTGAQSGLDFEFNIPIIVRRRGKS